MSKNLLFIIGLFLIISVSFIIGLKILRAETTTITCSSESIIGDANGDGDITLADASLVNDVYFGRKPKPSNICCLDANGDGDITPRDVQYIKSYYMKDGGETGN
ncbi:MAG: hypothetical protein COS49_01960, partial [Candidatus Portnoybacteria bacterium CG03_land_8_20_14_0_80_41_10]